MFREKVLRSFYVLLIFCAVLAGCSDANRPKEELLKEGVSLIDQDNSRGAIVFLKNAIEKDQNYFEARFQLARAYYNLNNFDNAEKELQKVIRQNPSLVEARVMLAKLDLQKSNADDALKQLDGLYGKDSSDAEAVEAAGLAFALKGDYRTAETLLQKAYGLGTKNHSAGVALAKVYIETDRMDKAMAQALDVLEKDGGNAGALFLLAEMQTRAGDLKAAIETYDRVLKASPSASMALFRKGVLHMEMKDYEAAFSVAGSLIEKHPKRPEGYKLEGMALLYKKDYEGAIVSFQKALSMSSDPGSHYFLGLAHYYKGEPEQAMSQMQKSIDMMPSTEQPRIIRAMILLKQNKVDDAANEAKKVVEINPRNALAHNILGSAYMAKGVYEKGMAELNMALDIDPTLADAHIKKGAYYISQGRLKEAEIDLKTAVEVAPEALNSRVLLANYYVKRREYKKALDMLRGGLDGTKKDAVLLNLAAELMLQQNKADEAMASLEKAKAADPDFYVPYFNLTTLYLMKGKTDKGLDELKKVLERYPENVKAIVSIATILEGKGDADGARKYYAMAGKTGKMDGLLADAAYRLKKKDEGGALKLLDTAIGNEPSNEAPYEIKGRILMSRGDHKAALDVFEELEKISPRKGLAYILNAYVTMKRPGDALSRLKDEMGKSPDDLSIQAEVSRIYMIMGEHEKAIANAKDIIGKKPSAPNGYAVLSMIYTGRKDMDSAVSVLKEGINGNKKDPNLVMMLGDVYALKGDDARALETYRKAEGVSSNDAQAIFKQGMALERMGQRKKAVDEYLRVLRISIDHVPALNNLAYLYAEDSRELDKAQQAATRAYMLSPNQGPVVDTLGYVLLKKGKNEEAFKVLKKAVELVPADPAVLYHFALACEKTGKKPMAIENLRKALGMKDFKDAGAAKRLLSELEKRGGR